jgi:hypothetical protein
MQVILHKGTFFTMSYSDGLFVLRLDMAVKGSADQAWEWINCIQSIKAQIGRPFPLLSVIEYKVEFTSEARRILRQMEDVEHFIAHAIWAESQTVKAMVKFLVILVPRNRFEVNVFLKKAKALSWLQERMNQSFYAAISEEEAMSVRIEINQEPN